MTTLLCPVRAARRARLALEPLETRLAPATFTVVNANASGPGSLAQAVLDANADAAADRVVFNIPGPGVHTIRPTAPLFVTAPITIDGYTQPGARPNTRPVRGPDPLDGVLLIELDGTNATVEASGIILVNVSTSTIRGLVINRYGQHGIEIRSDGAHGGNAVFGNYLGTDPSGTQDRGNGQSGVHILNSSTNAVGNRTPANANLISGNGGAGILIEGAAAVSNITAGNAIGTTAGGLATATALGNDGGGVRVRPDAIGAGVDGNRIAFNGGPGVSLNGSNNNPVTDNHIYRNNGDGVTVLGGFGNNVAANSLFENAGLGIDLADDGPTANDPGDADTGPNGLQNAPELLAVRVTGAPPNEVTEVQARLRSTPNTAFRLELFMSTPTSPPVRPGDIEGEVSLRLFNVNTDGTGLWEGVIPLAGRLPNNRYLTAVAAHFTANAGFLNTSEFSDPLLVNCDPLELFVTALYQDVLRRAPDAGGLSFWVGQLNGGLSRAEVVRRFYEGPEHRGLQVDEYYATLLGRPADPAGRAFWAGALVSGVPEAAVIVSFLTSAEYTTAHPDDAAYVAGLYDDLLGRVPSAAEVAGWVALLTGGLPRADVARQFLTSPERYLRLIDQYYMTYLDRAGEPAGRDAWLTKLRLDPAATPATVAQEFLAGNEYFNLKSTC